MDLNNLPGKLNEIKNRAQYSIDFILSCLFIFAVTMRSNFCKFKSTAKLFHSPLSLSLHLSAQIRFRYNAIHECCYRGQADVLKRVLEILEMDDFWRTLHPTVDAETHASRRSRIIDLFLNR